MSASTRNLKRADTGIDTACWVKWRNAQLAFVDKDHPWMGREHLPLNIWRAKALSAWRPLRYNERSRKIRGRLCSA
jgi:hypothetical protein